MTEPKWEDFEDPKDYFSARCDWLQARVQELERHRMITTCTVHGEITLGCACHHCLYDQVAENTRLREERDQWRAKAALKGIDNG